MMRDLKSFKFWCQKVLPLVYDDSLSYYEVLCKVVDYINNLIKSDETIIADIDGVKSDLSVVQKWIDEYDTTVIEELIKEQFLKMIIVGLTDDGYIVISVPDSWDDITFNTTGLDITIDEFEYGRLVLSY